MNEIVGRAAQIDGFTFRYSVAPIKRNIIVVVFLLRVIRSKVLNVAMTIRAIPNLW